MTTTDETTTPAGKQEAEAPSAVSEAAAMSVADDVIADEDEVAAVEAEVRVIETMTTVEQANSVRDYAAEAERTETVVRERYVEEPEGRGGDETGE